MAGFQDKWRIFTENTQKKLYIFDFDHTLADTAARVTDKETGERLTQAEFDQREHSPDFNPARYDFAEFDQVIEPKVIKFILKKLRKVVNQGHSAVILTARGLAGPVDDYIDSHLGVHGVPVVAVNDPNFESEETKSNDKKMAWIRQNIKQGYAEVHFFDDSMKNISAVKTLREEFPNATIKLYHVNSKERTQPVTRLEEMEVYQQKVHSGHPSWKKDIIGRGNQKPGPPFNDKPSMKRSKSAPVGAGGS